MPEQIIPSKFAIWQDLVNREGLANETFNSLKVDHPFSGSNIPYTLFLLLRAIWTPLAPIFHAEDILKTAGFIDDDTYTTAYQLIYNEGPMAWREYFHRFAEEAARDDNSNPRTPSDQSYAEDFGPFAVPFLAWETMSHPESTTLIEQQDVPNGSLVSTVFQSLEEELSSQSRLSPIQLHFGSQKRRSFSSMDDIYNENEGLSMISSGVNEDRPGSPSSPSEMAYQRLQRLQRLQGIQRRGNNANINGESRSSFETQIMNTEQTERKIPVTESLQITSNFQSMQKTLSLRHNRTSYETQTSSFFIAFLLALSSVFRGCKVANRFSAKSEEYPYFFGSKKPSTEIEGSSTDTYATAYTTIPDGAWRKGKCSPFAFFELKPSLRRAAGKSIARSSVLKQETAEIVAIIFTELLPEHKIKKKTKDSHLLMISLNHDEFWITVIRVPPEYFDYIDDPYCPTMTDSTSEEHMIQFRQIGPFSIANRSEMLSLTTILFAIMCKELQGTDPLDKLKEDIEKSEMGR